MICNCDRIHIEIGQHSAECPQRQVQERYWREWAKQHIDDVMGQPEPMAPSGTARAPSTMRGAT